MLALKNNTAYYITIQAKRDSELKTLYAGEDKFGLVGFYLGFDKAKCFSCALSAEKWFKFYFDEGIIPKDYYNWETITIEKLELIPYKKIEMESVNIPVEDSVENKATKPKRNYNKKKTSTKTEIAKI